MSYSPHDVAKLQKNSETAKRIKFFLYLCLRNQNDNDMEEMTLEFIIRIFVAALLGGAIGLERDVMTIVASCSRMVVNHDADVLRSVIDKGRVEVDDRPFILQEGHVAAEHQIVVGDGHPVCP